MYAYGYFPISMYWVKYASDYAQCPILLCISYVRFDSVSVLVCISFVSVSVLINRCYTFSLYPSVHVFSI
ncbi:hypothetical protein HanRHA438_Chr07g0295941 [Helianthus annuus]|nr:hypothetical protein HanIR_Chr07g0307651 [Helianthus annuus]KAJ0907190.1 hypothetical protein HanRHA438_Chr07g0295941 [Helianthus annuus]